ncbi:hypothetical protein RFI_24978 [Reticulomyxa filosa]|uniref:Serpin domain-containing protein n=1 Tax=Reticulomyxa filosa TaxID=46433 RepID=X6MEI3_RETFI|nr:hypothetical protein RFI_24978 [Reticulomyxa filosa]|eukprot:ETO12398.1 hypothetical protein RFI_24978 [Reticulomyxa filosa]
MFIYCICICIYIFFVKSNGSQKKKIYAVKKRVFGKDRVIHSELSEQKLQLGCTAIMSTLTSTRIASIINGWADEQTQDISDIDERVRMIITNAIYFKGEFVQMFDATPRFSKITKGKSAEGTHYEQCVVNPSIKNCISAISQINVKSCACEEELTTYEQKSYPRLVNLSVPKFECETSIKAIETYQAMRISKAFSASADFNDMFDDKAITYIKEIYHKALIELDEKGL